MDTSDTKDQQQLPAVVACLLNELKRRGIECEDSQLQSKCIRLDVPDVERADSQRTGHPFESRRSSDEQCASTSGHETVSRAPSLLYAEVCDAGQAQPPSPLLKSPLPSGKAGTLVLDMDKTLLFKEWRLQPFDRRPQVVYNPDFNFHITYRGYPVQYHVKKRPFLNSFLERAAALFEVVLFTASESIVTLPVVKQLDPKGTLIHHVLCRDACTEREGLYVKDLARLGRDLSRTVIIDDNPDSFLWQPENAILVGEFCGWEEHDQELLRLTPLLETLAMAEDMRTVVADLTATSDRQDADEDGADDTDEVPSGPAAAVEVIDEHAAQQQQRRLQQEVGTPGTSSEDVQEEQSEDSVVYY